MARRVFLSILGTGRYQPCRYEKDGRIYETKFIQQALLEYLKNCMDWGKEGDNVVVFLTPEATEKNWSSEDGLEKALQALDVQYAPVAIKGGKSTEEMWSIFETIFSQLQEEDELYIDITHSFRYLPMLLVVLVNYAKLLKNVSVAGIYYGNWEASNFGKDVAPVMDLLPLSSLQDWTAAASDFLQYGQIDKLHSLSENSLRTIMRDPKTRDCNSQTMRSFINNLKYLVDNHLACRGLDIIKGKEIGLLRRGADSIENITIAQLGPIFEKIKSSLKTYGEENELSNCIKAARWCYENKLYQQCTTLLEEGIITLLCSSAGLDYTVEEDRDLVNNSIYIMTNNTPEEKWKVRSEEGKEKIRKIIDEAKGLWKNKEFIETKININSLRNDYNHAGFNTKKRKPSTLIQSIYLYLTSIEKILQSYTL